MYSTSLKGKNKTIDCCAVFAVKSVYIVYCREPKFFLFFMEFHKKSLPGIHFPYIHIYIQINNNMRAIADG